MITNLGDVIAILALLFSVYATYKTHKFRKSEKEFLEVQKEVNALVLEKEKREAAQAKNAELSASFITIGNKHRLKILNKGQANAYKVNIDFPEGNELIAENEIRDKFPLEMLEQGQSVELVASFAFHKKPKLAIKLLWQNMEGQTHQKVVYPTL